MRGASLDAKSIPCKPRRHRYPWMAVHHAAFLGGKLDGKALKEIGFYVFSFT
jgi:hypothetical protein